MIESYDVAIIGAGTAGLAALREVRKHTDDFVIINAGSYGTTCARVGCMPSKALIESANAYHCRRHLAAFGITGAEHLNGDVRAVLRRVRQLRDEFVAGILPLTDSLGERNIAARARFIEPNVLDVKGRRVRARTIIVATGSRPIVPDHWRKLGNRLITSDDLFERDSLPPTLAVVGMGSIGTEIAQALARLGIRITGFGSDNAIAGLTDGQVNTNALSLLGSEFQLITGHRADVDVDGDRVRVGAGDAIVHADAVLAAIGRRPNIDGLGLETLGVDLDESGVPRFDRHSMQVGDLPVYVAGDMTGRLAVLHEANDGGHIAGYNALTAVPIRFQRRTPLSIVFTDPNIALVGQRLDELDVSAIAIGRVDFSRQGRARIARENHGSLCVYARRRDARLVGAEMCAPRGEHLAHLLAFMIEQRTTVQQALRMPFYHPVIEEGLRTALRDLAKQLNLNSSSDLASCDPIGAAALD